MTSNIFENEGNFIIPLSLDKLHAYKINRMLKIRSTPIDRNRKNGIKKWSIEVEGAFKGEPLNYEHDGSVCVTPDRDEYDNNIHDYFGEAKSNICLNSLDLKKFVMDLYENMALKFDSSCGLHIHIQLKNDRHYQSLMTREFWSYFLDWLDWFNMTYSVKHGHRFYKRIAGSNSYCYRKYRADEQYHLTHKESCRYCFINYCYNIQRRSRNSRNQRISKKGKTIEFRVFCMFRDPKMTIHLLQEFKRMINSFLACDDNSLKYNSTTLQKNEYWEKGSDENDKNGVWKQC